MSRLSALALVGLLVPGSLALETASWAGRGQASSGAVKPGGKKASRSAKDTRRVRRSYGQLTDGGDGPNLIRPGGTLRFDGRTTVRKAAEHETSSKGVLASHWMRQSPGNRTSVDMRSDGVTVTTRLAAQKRAALRTRPTRFHDVRINRQNPARELHAFEYGADQKVDLGFARKAALTGYRSRHPDAARRLVPSREQLIVRPDGTQRLTISFDPKRAAQRLPLE